MMKMTKQFYSVSEAAETLGVSRGLLYSAIKKGEVPCRTIGARVLVPRHWVEAQSGPSPDPGTTDTDSPPSSEASS